MPSTNLKQSNKAQGRKTEDPNQEVFALIYCRVSSQRQADEGHGREAQAARCKDFCHTKGFIVDKVFTDTATGGGSFEENRAGQVEIIKHIDKYPFRKFKVVVDDQSRIARDTKAYITFKEQLKNRDVEFASPNFTFDDSPEGEYIGIVTQAGHQLQRQVNRRQVIQKMKARMEAGYWPFGGKKGYAITKDATHGKLAVPTKEALEILKPAIEGFATGKLTRKVDVCRYVVEHGFWTAQSPERYIDKMTAILTDPFYAGDIEYKAWEVSRRKGYHQGIISSETFEAVQKRLKNDGLGKRIRIDLSSDFEHRGLIVCDGCQSHLTASWCKGRTQKYAYYFCQNKTCEYFKKLIPRKDIEDRFDTLLKGEHLKSGVDKVVLAVFDKIWAYETSNLKYQDIVSEEGIKTLQDNIRRFTALAGAARSNGIREAYEIQVDEAMTKLKALKERPKMSETDLSVPYQTALGKAMGLLKSPYATWKKLGTHDKHELFYFIFEAKLPYNPNTGYQTAKIQSYTRLFQDFVQQNPLGVEMAGIEPACNRGAPDGSTAIAKFEV